MITTYFHFLSLTQTSRHSKAKIWSEEKTTFLKLLLVLCYNQFHIFHLHWTSHHVYTTPVVLNLFRLAAPYKREKCLATFWKYFLMIYWKTYLAHGTPGHCKWHPRVPRHPSREPLYSTDSSSYITKIELCGWNTTLSSAKKHTSIKNFASKVVHSNHSLKQCCSKQGHCTMQSSKQKP